MTRHAYLVERWNGTWALIDADTHVVKEGLEVVPYRDGRYVSHYEVYRQVQRCELVPVETHVRTEKAS